MQLAESSIALSVSGSEHVRQLAGVQEHMTEVGKYNDLEAELVATQQRLSESEALAEQRAAETNKLLISKLHDALNHLSDRIATKYHFLCFLDFLLLFVLELINIAAPILLDV